ncbi:MAG: cell division protein FtsW [Clostridia bacterium]|nr:cell division protein FtsW [Clostridia bacterium]
MVNGKEIKKSAIKAEGGADKRHRRAWHVGDLPLLVTVILLALYGTVMVASAGYSFAQLRYGDALYFIKRQAVWLAIGFFAMWCGAHTPLDLVKKFSPAAYAVTLILLVLTLAIGMVGNGAQRWISIGPITVQQSEIAKLTVVLMLSRYFSDNETRATRSKKRGEDFVFGTLLPCVILVLPIFLVMLQHHLSCIIILGTLGLLLIISAGVNMKYLYGFMGAGAAGVCYIAFFTDYTKERITVWQNPEAYKLTGGWQTLQGLMAIGSGGLFGKGLGDGELKHSYVSEPANDMIFAILCEELGFLGAVAALLLFAVLIYRGYKIAMRAGDAFSRLTALGITFKMALQTLLNVAVVTNTIPNTGISLPLFSYGGSSLIMILFEMGLLLSIARGNTAVKSKLKGGAEKIPLAAYGLNGGRRT